MATVFEKSECGQKICKVSTSEVREEYDLPVLLNRRAAYQKDVLHYTDKLAEVEELISQAKELGVLGTEDGN